MKNFEKEREEILKRFHELKETGKSFNLGDTLSDEQKERFTQNEKHLTLADKLTSEQKEKLANSNISDILDIPFANSRVAVSHYDPISVQAATSQIAKFLSKALSKFSEIEIIDEYSFAFNFKGEIYRIGYDYESECMVINEGRDFDDDNAREIGYSEFKENYIYV